MNEQLIARKVMNMVRYISMFENPCYDTRTRDAGIEILEPLPMPVRGMLLIAYGDYAFTIGN